MIYKVGLWIRTFPRDTVGDPVAATWRTPAMFGNSDRSPLLPFEHVPYFRDFEDYLKFKRIFDYRMTEIILLHQVRMLTRAYHPQREDRDDMTVRDAEFEADIIKRLDEQRHEMAI